MFRTALVIALVVPAICAGQQSSDIEREARKANERRCEPLRDLDRVRLSVNMDSDIASAEIFEATIKLRLEKLGIKVVSKSSSEEEHSRLPEVILVIWEFPPWTDSPYLHLHSALSIKESGIVRRKGRDRTVRVTSWEHSWAHFINKENLRKEAEDRLGTALHRLSWDYQFANSPRKE